MGEEKCAILTTDVNQQKKIGDFLFCKKVRKRPGAKQEKFEDCVIDMKSFICLEAIQNVKLSMSSCQKLDCNRFSDSCPRGLLYYRGVVQFLQMERAISGQNTFSTYWIVIELFH